jgi:hypothetical protein
MDLRAAIEEAERGLAEGGEDDPVSGCHHPLIPGLAPGYGRDAA